MLAYSWCLASNCRLGILATHLAAAVMNPCTNTFLNIPDPMADNLNPHITAVVFVLVMVHICGGSWMLELSLHPASSEKIKARMCRTSTLQHHGMASVGLT
jgi:hypothetical protein